MNVYADLEHPDNNVFCDIASVTRGLKFDGLLFRSPLVLQSFVYGDSLKGELVAIVVPDPEALLPWAKEHNLSQHLEELCNDPVVIEAVLASMQAEGSVAKLAGFEQVGVVVSCQCQC